MEIALSTESTDKAAAFMELKVVVFEHQMVLPVFFSIPCLLKVKGKQFVSYIFGMLFRVPYLIIYIYYSSNKIMSINTSVNIQCVK